MQKKILCQSCGAENAHYGKCEYCGTEIENIEDTTEKYISHGKQNVTIDERVLIQKYDKFEDKSETFFRYGSNEGHVLFQFNTEEYGKAKKEEDEVLFSHIHEKSEEDYYYLGLDDCIIHIDGQNYKIKYHEISNEMLSAICKANHVGVKFKHLCYDAYFDQESTWLFVTMAQTFYNTFIDSSCYTDAAEKLYTYYEKKQDEAKLEEQIKQKREMEQKEKVKIGKHQTMVLIFIFAILPSLIFSIICFLSLLELYK